MFFFWKCFFEKKLKKNFTLMWFISVKYQVVRTFVKLRTLSKISNFLHFYERFSDDTLWNWALHHVPKIWIFNLIEDADGVMGISNTKISLPNQILQNKIYDDTMNLCFAHNGGFMDFGRTHIPEDIKYTDLLSGSKNNLFWHWLSPTSLFAPKSNGEKLVKFPEKDFFFLL